MEQIYNIVLPKTHWENNKMETEQYHCCMTVVLLSSISMECTQEKIPRNCLSVLYSLSRCIKLLQLKASANRSRLMY